MTSRDTAVGVATGYLRVGQQRNRGFISDKSTWAFEGQPASCSTGTGILSRCQSGGAWSYSSITKPS